MTCRSILLRSFGEGQNIIRETEARIIMNVRLTDILCHGCIIKAEIVTIINIGWIMMKIDRDI